MSLLYHTTGIVLSRRDFREADRWYAVYTSAHGKIEVLARGGHKPLAKLTPHLEIAAEVDLLVVRGRTFQTLAGVERRHRFLEPHADLSHWLLVQNGLALFDLAVREGERDVSLYELLTSWLAFVSRIHDVTDERSAYVLGSFVLKLMSACGYRPELASCLACRLPIAPGGYRWSGLKGGVVCAPCAEAREEPWFAARPMTDATLKLLRFALTQPFVEQLRLTLRAQDIGQFHEVLEAYLISHFPVIPAVSLRTACATSVLAPTGENALKC